MRSRVKICGITSPEQAMAAAESGADAIGLVFYPDSPRAVDPERAAAIAAATPAFVSIVGLFMDAPAAEVERTLERVPLELLQFHGRETPAFCRQFGRRYLKAIGMLSGANPHRESERYPDAAALLVDSHAGGRAGGSGERFDWDTLPRDAGRPLLLAGGLDPDNVGEAVERVRPWGVDVSSGVESEPGCKDPALMSRFIREVQRVCQA